MIIQFSSQDQSCAFICGCSLWWLWWNSWTDLQPPNERVCSHASLCRVAVKYSWGPGQKFILGTLLISYENQGCRTFPPILVEYTWGSVKRKTISANIYIFTECPKATTLTVCPASTLVCLLAKNIFFEDNRGKVIVERLNEYENLKRLLRNLNPLYFLYLKSHCALTKISSVGPLLRGVLSGCLSWLQLSPLQFDPQSPNRPNVLPKTPNVLSVISRLKKEIWLLFRTFFVCCTGAPLNWIEAGRAAAISSTQKTQHHSIVVQLTIFRLKSINMMPDYRRKRKRSRLVWGPICGPTYMVSLLEQHTWEPNCKYNM